MGRPVTGGDPHPLGATPGEGGSNFALFSRHAEAVDLCLFESASDTAPSEVVPLAARTHDVFHARVAGVGPGQVYGYRVRGPWAPEAGQRFDPSKVLLDPYARAVARAPRWSPSVYSYDADRLPCPESAGRLPSGLDSGADAPLGIVAAEAGPDQCGSRPRTSWSDTFIYELHVRGFTMLHPDVAPEHRGTFAGLASEPVLEYISGLGVTAVELLPVQAHVDDHRLEKLGLTNYWGYQPLGFFAPEPSFGAASAHGVIAEFQSMVRRFHAAGIEVILDVVFNHTGEAGHDGPTLSFRGIDNATYYRLCPEDRSRYVDHSGCGNSLNTYDPAVVRLVLDSLRYWVRVMGVDGFRFDLATSLGRTTGEFDRWCPLLTAIGQDPALQHVKLIAEPWDLNAADSVQLGNFPRKWAEWNGRFRDDVRRFWRGDPGSAPAFATRVAGSSDIFGPRGRPPQASVNFVTSHDGFTLADLVSYRRKRNEANGEGGADGESENLSWNCGIEGPTHDSAVHALRERQRRNLLATLMLSQGVPMLVAGDEFGRSQAGNNNAYCQDNAVSWVDWRLAEGGAAAAFLRRLARIRRSEPALRRELFFHGILDHESGARDLHWLHPSGSEIAGSEWHGAGLRSFAAQFTLAQGAAMLLLFNAYDQSVRFALPGRAWRVEVDTAALSGPDRIVTAGSYELADRSCALLRSTGD